MSVNLLKLQPRNLSLQTLKKFNKCCYSTKSNTGIVGELDVEDTPRYEVEVVEDEETLKNLRDISRLNPSDRNILHGQRPYDESKEWYHDTVWYKKRIMGRYGIAAARVNPAIAWPTKEEIEDKKEYERVLYPVSIQDLWKQIEEKKQAEALEIRKKEEEIEKAAANFDKWRADLQAKIEKKEAALKAAKEKKQRMLLEIREQFGFQIDMKDPRFLEMVEKKEKEDKKKKKEAKKQKTNEKFLAYIARQEEELKAKKAEEMKAEEEEEAKETKVAEKKAEADDDDNIELESKNEKQNKKKK